MTMSTLNSTYTPSLQVIHEFAPFLVFTITCRLSDYYVFPPSSYVNSYYSAVATTLLVYHYILTVDVRTLKYSLSGYDI